MEWHKGKRGENSSVVNAIIALPYGCLLLPLVDVACSCRVSSHFTWQFNGEQKFEIFYSCEPKRERLSFSLSFSTPRFLKFLRRKMASAFSLYLVERAPDQRVRTLISIYTIYIYLPPRHPWML